MKPSRVLPRLLAGLVVCLPQALRAFGLETFSEEAKAQPRCPKDPAILLPRASRPLATGELQGTQSPNRYHLVTIDFSNAREAPVPLNATRDCWVCQGEFGEDKPPLGDGRRKALLVSPP